MTIYTAQTYNNPSTLNSDPGDPVTSELVKAGLGNPRAIAQSASGADTMEQAPHILGETASGTGALQDFDGADVTDQNEIWLCGYGTFSGTSLRLELDYASSGWTTALTLYSGGGLTADDFRLALRISNLNAWATDQTRILSGQYYADGSLNQALEVISVAQAAEGVRLRADGGGQTISATFLQITGIKGQPL